MRQRSLLTDMFARDERRAAGMLLAEGYDYRRMADPIMAVARREMGNERALRDMQTIIENDITNIRVMLRRYDRVMWYLRMWRIGCASNYLWSQGPQGQELVSRLAADLSRKSGMSVDAILDEGRRLYLDGGRSILRNLQHFFSLPVPAIQNMRFQDRYSVLQTMDELRAAERAWQDEVKDSFEPDQDDTPIIRFKDGLAWWLLDREHCGVEGKAMGHCGNSADWKEGDRLLSLRQSFTVGGRLRVKPYLTFILRDGNVLGEMKGRFNQKPSHAFKAGHAPSDFHDEIVTLLRHPLIQGIRGGGHAPDQNFSLRDLDDATREELMVEKPELGGPAYVLDKHGATSKEGIAAIKAYLDSIGLELSGSFELVGEDFVLDVWNSLEDFCEDEGDETVSYLLSILEMDHDDLMDNGFVIDTTLDPEAIYDILEYMPDEALEVLATELTLPYAPANDSVGFHRMLRRMSDEITRSVWDEDLKHVVLQSITGTSLKQAARARIGRYIDAGWSFVFFPAWLDVPKQGESHDLEGPVRLMVRAEDLAEAVINESEDTTEEGYHLYDVRLESREHGSRAWSSVSWQSTNEHRGNYGAKLTDRDGKDLMFDHKAKRSKTEDTPQIRNVPREDIDHKRAAYLLARRLLGHD